MKVVDFRVGCNIRWAAKQLVAAVPTSPDEKARGNFNGIMVVARKASTPETLVSQWRDKSEAKSKKYSRTAKAKTEASRWAQYEASVQQKHDELMQQLPTLNFASDVTVLDWLCEYQNPSDFSPVTNRVPKTVVQMFAQHGYYPVMGTDNLDESDRGAVANMIIGQALDCLAGFGSIHQVIHHWVQDWKKKFVTVH